VTTTVTDDVLRRSPLFRRVAVDDRARIARLAHLKRYERGETIFAEGTPADAFITIVEGRVKVFKATPSGKEIILEIFGPGDPLGAVAAYESSAFPASAQALEPSLCLAIGRRDFFQLLEQYPALVRGLLSGLTLRLAELTRRLTDLSGSRVDARLARLLLTLADRIGTASGDAVFVALPLSRQELGDLTGTTIETTIRIMSRWQKDDVVRTEKGGFHIVDRATLQAIAAS
jgi:CRP/FNR family transcriptional regulator